MNILHLTPYYAPAYAFGGVVRAVEGMARALVERGHSITILTTDAISPSERWTGAADEMRDGVHVVRAPNAIPRGTFNLSTPRGLRQIGHDLVAGADVIHCHEFRTAENLLITPLAEKLGKPLVLSPHGTLTLTTGRSMVKSVWDALFSPAVARRFAHVIGLTQIEADEAQQFWGRFGASRTQFSVVPNGINLDEFVHLPDGAAFRQQWGLGDAPVCLFLGRLHPRKGAQLLAQAFRGLALPEARLVIAGPDEGALALIKPFLDGRIVVTGYLDAQARLSALAAADVFALPAVGEGLSMALLEAMAAGLPVIVSPGCNLPEAAAAGAGMEVEPEPEALTGALRALLSDADRREVMGSAARRLVEEQFTWRAVAVGLESVYEGVQSGKT
jgi:glycosyltransferase involved in cell wall biosynthesis